MPGENHSTYPVSFVTLGCAKNEVDTNRMRSIVEADPAFEVIDDPMDASAIIVNTCSFLTSAVEEGLEVVFDLLESRGVGHGDAKVVVTGCIPSRYGDQIVDEMPEVAAFVSVKEEDGIATVLRSVLGVEAHQTPAPEVKRVVESTTAYVKISDGCDRYCAFCAIPYIRGHYYSRPSSEIMEEVRFLAGNGVREVVLIGQDTGLWGFDLDEGHDIAWLLKEVAGVMGAYGGWVRILYLQPEGLSDALIDAIASSDAIVKYIDMPLQHSNAAVLKRMNRTGDTAEFLQTISNLRERIPGVTLRTTALVGFPGETEEDVDELVSFLEAACFDYCAVFAYSPEEGTTAALLPDQIDPDVKLEREQRLIDLSEVMGFASAASRIGGVYDVLVDGMEFDEDGNSELIGRAPFQAPDSDGVVHLGQMDASMGDIIKVRIVDSACYELWGEPVLECDVDTIEVEE